MKGENEITPLEFAEYLRNEMLQTTARFIMSTLYETATGNWSKDKGGIG